MIETRNKEINKKIFTKTDIKNIWGLFNSQYLPIEGREHMSRVTMQINCQDKTHYESYNDDLLSDGNIFDLKRVTSINMEYYNYDEDKRIEFNIVHSDSPHVNNSLRVKGSDKNWVAGIFSEFEVLLSSIKPQQHWFIKYKLGISFIGIVIFTFSFSRLLLSLNPKKDVLDLLDNTILIFCMAFISSLITLNFVSWVSKLWPNIEFDFGPEHTKNEKRRRNRLWTFITIILLPTFYLIIEYLI